MLFRSISEAMTKGQTILPETFDSTSVYFGSVVGFKEALANARTPLETVTMLNNLYSVCDDVIEKFDVFKVEVVIDAYLVLSHLIAQLSDEKVSPGPFCA
jgi:guanylate cyclase, other